MSVNILFLHLNIIIYIIVNKNIIHYMILYNIIYLILGGLLLILNY